MIAGLSGEEVECSVHQRPLPDGMLRIVAHGTKKDGGAGAAAPAGQRL
jgi:hypothetical protein